MSMTDKVSELKNWLKAFLKNKDTLTKSIVHMEEADDTIFVEYTSKKHLFIIHPHFEHKQHLLTQLESKEHPITLVTLNTKKNLLQTINWWDILIEHPNLSIYFVIPSRNDKWIIHPTTHDKIIERNTLEKGLKSLAEGIGFYD